MINTFYLVLLLITSVSGIFWFLKKLYFMLYHHNVCEIKIVQDIKNYIQYSSNFYSLLIVFFISVYKFISSMFPVLLLIFLIRSFVYEPFQIPSGSMMPTLLIGDFILVNKFVYGIKNPVTQHTLITCHHPKRGDLVVFKYPKNPKLNYIKRVIGEPGDKIIYDIIGKKLVIYPIDSTGLYKQSLPITYSNIMFSDFIQIFHKSETGMITTRFITQSAKEKNSDGIRLIKTTESLNGIQHDILTMISPGDTRFTEMYDQHSTYLISEWIVPNCEYFVMGDNRDNSSDSRYWGCVPECNIVGKAVIIWMHLKKENSRFPTGIQLNRIGSIH